MDFWSPWDLLPGAWVAALALVGGTVLSRVYDPVPRWVWGIFAGLVALLLGPALVGGAVLLPLDTLRGFAPFTSLPPTEPHGNLLQGDLIQLVAPSAERVREELLAGRWPLWNPYVGAGMPLLADPQAQAFQPLVLTATPLPWLQGAGVVAALRLLTALVFTYLLLARQELRPAAALFGAVAYGLGGFLMLWLGWPLASSAAWLPAVLYALVRVDQEGGRRDCWLLGAVTAALLLAGHPETVAYALAVAALFALDRLRVRWKGWRWPYLRRVLVTWALTAVAVAPVLLPTALYLPGTVRWALATEAPREGGAPAPEAPEISPGPGESLRGPRPVVDDPVERLALAWLPLAVPNAFGNSRYLDYWGGRNSNEDAAGFVGTAALLGALVGALFALDRLRRRLLRRWLRDRPQSPWRPQEGLMLALAGSGVLGLALAEPGSPRRWLLAVALALAYLGAVTVERFAAGEGKLWALALAAVGLATVIFRGSGAFPHPVDPETLEVLRHGWLLWHLRFLTAAALALALLWVLNASRLAAFRAGRLAGPRGAAVTWVGQALLVAAVAGELVLAHRDVHPPAPRDLARSAGLGDVGEGPGALAALDRLPDVRDPLTGGRIAALGRALPPNVAALYRLADIRVYNPVEPLEYHQALTPVTAEPRGTVPALEERDHRLYDRLGVRYLLTSPGVDIPPPAERIYSGADAWIYRRPSSQGRFFLELNPTGNDPGGGGAIEAISGPSGAAWSARVALREPGRVASGLYQPRLSPRVPAPVRAAVSKQGWKAVALPLDPRAQESSGGDGETRLQTPTHGDGLFVAVELAPGSWRLDLLYRPPGLLLGCLLAALALGTALAVGSRRPERDPAGQ